ncbi:MAG: ferritin family protein [candidate division Zixibacteria bacterium]|nr:ferritin family protein [candidate division Zixibacteria bacterium]
MDIFEFAMKMELDGNKYYESKAAITKEKNLKEILLTLAEEEMNHFNFFKKMKNGKTDTSLKEFNSSTQTLNKIKNIFVEMSQDDENKNVGESDIEIWKEALKIEEKAESFYREKAEAETDTQKKKLLILIAEEEQRHVHMVENVLYYLKFPESFAESAQFNNFQSLEGR